MFPNQSKWIIHKADWLCCEGCKVDDDCKWNNEKCDQEDGICRPRCTEHEDCNSIPCNTDKGVCDPSKILFNSKWANLQQAIQSHPDPCNPKYQKLIESVYAIFSDF